MRSQIPILGSLIGSMSFTSKEVGLTDFPPTGPTSGAHPASLPSGSWSVAVWLMLAAGVGRFLSKPQRIALERNRLRCSGLIFLSFPVAIHRDAHRLVDGGGGASAVDGLWRYEDSRRDDALPDGPRGDNLARRILQRLRLHIRIRDLTTSIGSCGLVRLGACSLCRRPPQSRTDPCRSSTSGRR